MFDIFVIFNVLYNIIQIIFYILGIIFFIKYLSKKWIVFVIKF